MRGFILLVIGALALQGCALGLVAAGAGGGAVGAQYLQPSDRTFTAPLEQVREAASRTLKHMDMTVTDDSPTADGRALQAHAGDRQVEVELENVTYNTTRMSVSVTQSNGIEKDHATEQELLQQTGKLLGGTNSSLGAADSPR